MRMPKTAQRPRRPVITGSEFGSLLHDTLYGLVIFFGLGAFIGIGDAVHLAFYVTALVIVVHWWLMFKTAEHSFSPGVRDTAVHVVVNIGYIGLLEIMVVYAQLYDYLSATAALLAVIMLDLVWVWAVEHARRWERGDRRGVAVMRRVMRDIMRTDIAVGIPLALLMTLSGVIGTGAYVTLFIFVYAVYVVLTFRYRIVDMRFF